MKAITALKIGWFFLIPGFICLFYKIAIISILCFFISSIFNGYSIFKGSRKGWK